jgi:RNA polymerase sigma-70 factor (ECF subfamily)
MGTILAFARDDDRGRGELLIEPAPAPGDLVLRIGSGDHRAEGELVERYGEGLLFLLRRWTRSRDEADDLYQETFRRAIEKIRGGEVRDPENLPAFLRGLARNLTTDHYRRTARRGGRETPIESTLEPQEGGPGQLGALLRQEKIGLVRRLLSELPLERDRQVLLRFYIHEEDKERICDDLALSRAEFNMALFRARRRYQLLFEKAVAGAGEG